MSVPMRGTGTEQSVVVGKSEKSDGAKGLCYPAVDIGQPVNGRIL